MSIIPIISSRKGFFDPGVISKRDGAKLVNLADARRATCEKIHLRMLGDRFANKSVFILVHGYNNTFEEVAESYQRIANLLQTSLGVKDDQLIGYMWPGGHQKLSYIRAKGRAKQLSRRTVTRLKEIGRSATEVNIIAHSLGCFLTMAMMKKAPSNKAQLSVKNIYLMAPAVSNNALSSGNIFFSAAKKADLIYVFKSIDDEVLPYYRVAEHGEKALGLTGPDPFKLVWQKTVVVDCSNQDPPILHSSYFHRSEIFDFITANSIVSSPPVVLPVKKPVKKHVKKQKAMVMPTTR